MKDANLIQPAFISRPPKSIQCPSLLLPPYNDVIWGVPLHGDGKGATSNCLCLPSCASTDFTDAGAGAINILSLTFGTGFLFIFETTTFALVVDVDSGGKVNGGLRVGAIGGECSITEEDPV